jgi:hypothetical protein
MTFDELDAQAKKRNENGTISGREDDTICPIMSIGKSKPIYCRYECEWALSEANTSCICAITHIRDELYSLRDFVEEKFRKK